MGFQDQKVVRLEGKVMLLRGKRPEEVGVWPLEEAVLRSMVPRR